MATWKVYNPFLSGWTLLAELPTIKDNAEWIKVLEGAGEALITTATDHTMMVSLAATSTPAATVTGTYQLAAPIKMLEKLDSSGVQKFFQIIAATETQLKRAISTDDRNLNITEEQKRVISNMVTTQPAMVS